MPQDDTAREVYPGEVWQEATTPEQLGWSSEKLAKAREYSERIGSAAVTIVDDGVVVDSWGDVTQNYMCHSVRKSLLSALYGIYAAEGKIDIPVAGPSVALGIVAGFCYASQSRNYADPRTATGRARVETQFLAVPLSIDARFSAAAATAGIEIGLGGGVLLSWAAARALGKSPDPELRVRPAGVAHVGGTLAVGPGQVILRLTYLLGQSFSARTVRKVSTSGAHLALGYRLGDT